MIRFITFSKPAKNAQEVFGKPYLKAKIRLISTTNEKSEYMAEFFTEKQAFQQKMSLSEAEDFFQKHGGTTFRNAVCRTDSEEITVMANRHGEIKRISRKIKDDEAAKANASVTRSPLASPAATSPLNGNRKKNYILEEGKPVPFLVKLGVMTKEGKVIAQKYEKFRQINRFLEFVKDIVPELQKLCQKENRPLQISDFGCGKSYLTFAVYYYLHEILRMPVEITGLDLKEDVIQNCTQLSEELGWTGLHFHVGDVAKFAQGNPPDLMITLHACDTATDYALEYAVKSNATAILSVPCCQHEINSQLQKQEKNEGSVFASLKNWGILQERFSALVTDAIRAEVLEQNGYAVQVMEFIDFEGTPKNLLIRAVKKGGATSAEKSFERMSALLNELKTEQRLMKLLSENK